MVIISIGNPTLFFFFKNTTKILGASCWQLRILGVYYSLEVAWLFQNMVYYLTCLTHFKSSTPETPKQLQIRVILLHSPYREDRSIHFPQLYQYKFKWPHLLEEKSEGGNQHLIKLWGNCCSWEDIGWHKLMLTTVDYWGYLHYYQNRKGFPNIGSTKKVYRWFIVKNLSITIFATKMM